jgi:hypothetical protein
MDMDMDIIQSQIFIVCRIAPILDWHRNLWKFLYMSNPI